MAGEVKLTKSQISFLKFHADEPYPHSWEWLGNDEPDTWGRLCAGKPGRQCTISRDELAQLSELGFIHAFRVTPAGRAALKSKEG